MYLFWINFKLSLPFSIGAKILNWELFLKHQSTTSKQWSNRDNVEEDIFKNFKKSLSIQFFIWSPDSYKFPLILHCYLFKYFFQCLPLSSILQFLCDLCRHFSSQYTFCWCVFSRVLLTLFCVLHTFVTHSNIEPIVFGKNLGRRHFRDKHTLLGELSDGRLTLNNGRDNVIIVICHGDVIVEHDHSDLICFWIETNSSGDWNHELNCSSFFCWSTTVN